MPFLAERPDRTVVFPKDFGNTFDRDTTLTCTHCNGGMHFRKSATKPNGHTARRAHFVHEADDPDACATGGESERHQELKHDLADLLTTIHDGTLHIEHPIGDHVADVAIEFNTPDPKMGKGVALEVQCKNKSKDYVGATMDFLDNDYSVQWVFDGYDLLYDAKESLDRALKDVPYLKHIDEDDAITSLPEPISIKHSKDESGIFECIDCETVVEPDFPEREPPEFCPCCGESKLREVVTTLARERGTLAEFDICDNDCQRGYNVYSGLSYNPEADSMQWENGAPHFCPWCRVDEQKPWCIT